MEVDNRISSFTGQKDRGDEQDRWRPCQQQHSTQQNVDKKDDVLYRSTGRAEGLRVTLDGT